MKQMNVFLECNVDTNLEDARGTGQWHQLKLMNEV